MAVSITTSPTTSTSISGDVTGADTVAGVNTSNPAPTAKIRPLMRKTRRNNPAAGVVAPSRNRPIADRKRPILSFGQDQNGEVYLLSTASDGRGVFRFERTK